MSINILKGIIKHKKSIQSVSVYLLASIIPACISLIINPIIAVNLSPLDYSIVGFYTSFNLLFTPLLSLYLTHYYSKRYFEINEGQREDLKKRILSMFFTYSLLISIILYTGLWIYMSFFNPNSTIPFFPYAALYISYLYLLIFFSFQLTDLKMKKKVKEYLYLSIIQSISIAIFTIILVVIIKLGALGRMLAYLCEALLLFTIVMYANKSNIKIQINLKEEKPILIFCFPLIVAGSLSFFTKGFDSVLLERIGDDVNFAFFSIGLQFTSYLSLAMTAIQNTFQPDIYEAIVLKNKRKTIQIFSLLIGTAIVIVTLFIIFAPFVVHILTWGRYDGATLYTQILSLSIIFSTAYYLISTTFIARGFTYSTLTVRGIMAFASILIVPFIINKFQFIGGCLVQSFSFIIGLIVYTILSLIKKRKISLR